MHRRREPPCRSGAHPLHRAAPTPLLRLLLHPHPSGERTGDRTVGSLRRCQCAEGRRDAWLAGCPAGSSGGRRAGREGVEGADRVAVDLGTQGALARQGSEVFLNRSTVVGVGYKREQRSPPPSGRSGVQNKIQPPHLPAGHACQPLKLYVFQHRNTRFALHNATHAPRQRTAHASGIRSLRGRTKACGSQDS